MKVGIFGSGVALRRALAWLAMAGIVGLASGCDCAYGGAGCGLPALEGLCESRLESGRSLVVTTVYGDDTGYHPALVRSAETTSPSILEVAHTGNRGELSLSARASGQADLQLKVDGWGSGRFTWSFTVQDQPVEPTGECADVLRPSRAE